MNANDKLPRTRLSRANTLHSLPRDTTSLTPLSSSLEDIPGNGEHGPLSVYTHVNTQVNTRPRQLSSSRLRAHSGSIAEGSITDNFNGSQGNTPGPNFTPAPTHRKRLSMNFAALPISVNQTLSPVNSSPVPSSVANGQNAANHYFHSAHNSPSHLNPVSSPNGNTTIPSPSDISTVGPSPAIVHHSGSEVSNVDSTSLTHPLASISVPGSEAPAITTSYLPTLESNNPIAVAPGAVSKQFANFRSPRRSLSLSIRPSSSPNINRSTAEPVGSTETHHVPVSKQTDPTMDYLNGLAVKERLVFELKEQMKRISEELALAEKELQAFRDHAPIALRPTSMMNSKNIDGNNTSSVASNSTLNVNESNTSPIALEILSENQLITPETSFINTAPTNVNANSAAGAANHRYSYGNMISQPLSMLDSLQSKITGNKDRYNYNDSKEKDVSPSRYHNSSFSNISNITVSSIDDIPEDSEDGFGKNFNESLIIGASYNENKSESNTQALSNSFLASSSQSQKNMPIVIPHQSPPGDIVHVGKRVAAEIGKNFWGFMKDIKEVAMGEEESDDIKDSQGSSLNTPLEENSILAETGSDDVGSGPEAIALVNFNDDLQSESTEYFSDDMDISNFKPDQLSSPLSSSSVKTTFIQDSSEGRSRMPRSTSLLHRSKGNHCQ